jgi:ABC-type antimicrobial peptide transport system permease subunit
MKALVEELLALHLSLLTNIKIIWKMRHRYIEKEYVSLRTKLSEQLVL